MGINNLYFRNLKYGLLSLLLWGCGGIQSSDLQRDSLLLLDVDDNEVAYLVKNNRSLIKLDTESGESFLYDLKWPLTDFGVQAELKCYAFSVDYQKFVILDRYLNEIVHIDFRNYFDFQVDRAVLGNSQTIWLYNALERKLQCWTASFELLSESQSLDLVIPGFQIGQLLIRDNKVYAIDESRGIFEFDYTGQLIHSYVLDNFSLPVQMTADHRAYFKIDENWFTLDLRNKNSVQQTVHFSELESIENINHLIFKEKEVFYLKEGVDVIMLNQNYSILE